MDNQKSPKMGSEHRTSIQNYKDELRRYAEETGDRVVLAMIDCCDFLLIEANRLERRKS